MRATGSILKRVIDILLAVAIGTLVAPLLAVIAMVSLAVLGRPILFYQKRVGQHGRLFQIVKFRTMIANAHGIMSEDDAGRMTPFGSFLRRFSLDELPELWNILVGDMSLVGPRPLLPEYLPLYSTRQARRHEVCPGITGWAQVNGRNALTWEERFDLDVWYVDHQSVWLDLKILWLTVWTVLRRDGISQPGHVTMEKFRGSPR